MFFDLKPSSFQGESSLKISARKQTNKQTNNQTDSLTDWCFYRVIIDKIKDSMLKSTKRFEILNSPNYLRIVVGKKEGEQALK